MSVCDELSAIAADGIAPALQAVDCLANNATARAFARLFGAHGALTPALTILLTLYISFFAISLLTGRSRLGVTMLSRRAMSVGLVLTFATSWLAYQSVVWNLAVAAPDYLASVLMGSRGSATMVFGEHMDMVFAAITEATSNEPVAGAGAGVGAVPAAAGTFSASNLMWISALLLLLGTVGALITARIAMAVLLALGPVFIVLALFQGSRGLFVGWLRGAVMTATAPLFVVLGGGFMLELIVPIVGDMQAWQGAEGKAAIALFVVASVHLALMFLVFRVLGQMVAAWSIFGLGAERAGSERRSASDYSLPASGAPAAEVAASAGALAMSRTRALAAATSMPAIGGEAAVYGSHAPLVGADELRFTSVELPTPRRTGQSNRARGIGSRYRSKPVGMSEMAR